MNKLTTFLAFVIALCAAPLPARACSLALLCNHDATEMRRDFTILVSHEGSPLAGVSVQMTREGSDSTPLSGKTGSNGKLQMRNVPSGKYWLKTELLGISTVQQCFHINQHATGKAQRNFNVEWGQLAPASSRIAGKLIVSESARSENSVWNFVHRVEIPIAGASLKLQDPVTGNESSTVSDQNGAFDFSSVLKGTYVLHIEGGHANEHQPKSDDLLIKFDAAAERSSLLLVQWGDSGGSCGVVYSLDVQK
ncbi:MAG: hypothetical protein JWO13_124 [Acidobacteriales bacterium]|nr:hypothetical protein [Terriglobales bacterium]